MARYKVAAINMKSFIGVINKMEGMHKYSLPTEAQWEYAARAGSSTVYCFGDDPCHLNEHAWYKDNSEDMTHPVGLKKPNDYGLYDMYGNVLEWCQEEYGKYPSGSVTDPIKSDRWGSNRLARGGCYCLVASDCRSAKRNDFDPDYRSQIP